MRPFSLAGIRSSLSIGRSDSVGRSLGGAIAIIYVRVKIFLSKKRRLTSVRAIITIAIDGNSVTADTGSFVDVFRAGAVGSVSDGRTVGDVAVMVWAAGLSLNSGVAPTMGDGVRHCGEPQAPARVDCW